MGEVKDFLWNKKLIDKKSVLSYILDFENFKRNSEILGWTKDNRLSFKERLPEIKDKITYSFLFFINQEKKSKKTLNVYDFIKIFIDFIEKIVRQFPVFRGDDSSFYDRVVGVVERFTPLVSEIVEKINAADVLIIQPRKKLSNNEILNSNFRISISNVSEFLNVVNRSNLKYYANILFFDLKNPFNEQNPEGFSLLKKTLELSNSILFAKNASEAVGLEKYLIRLKKEMDEMNEKEFALFKKEDEDKNACIKRIIRQIIESNIFVDNEVKDYLSSKFGISSKVDPDLDIKMAGQIPAGMHNFILNTGLFGESNYDELEWIRRESDKTIKEYEKNLKKIRLST
jgi:hypothetical protein